MELFLHFIVEREHKEAFLELALRIANSDGFVNRNELNYIKGWAFELGLDDWQPTLDSDRPLADLVGHLQDERLKHIFIAEILLLIYSDGNYSDQEKAIAAELQRLFGYDEATFNQFLDWAAQMNNLKVEGMKLILHSALSQPAS